MFRCIRRYSVPRSNWFSRLGSFGFMDLKCYSNYSDRVQEDSVRVQEDADRVQEKGYTGVKRVFSENSNLNETFGNEFLVYAAEGSVEKMKTFLNEYPEFNINYANFEGRTALHIAVTMGNFDACEFLIGNGANVNVVDQWNHTPLTDAIMTENVTMFHYLESVGGETGMTEKEKTLNLNQACALGDIQKVKMWVEMRANVNDCDYDQRYPLHLACDCGSIDIVLFLLEMGADINKVDKFGRTPISDAIAGKHKELVDFLFANGAKLPSQAQNISRSTELSMSLRKAMPYLLERIDCQYCEPYTPTTGLTELKRYSFSNQIGVSLPMSSGASYKFGEGVPGRCWKSKETIAVTEINEDCFVNAKELKESGVKSALAVPLVIADEVFAVLIFYNYVSESINFQEEFSKFTNGIVLAGIESVVDYSLPKTKIEEVVSILNRTSRFDPVLLFHEVDRFFHHIGIPEIYFQHFPTVSIAKHINSLASAKMVGLASRGDSEDVYFANESEDHAYFLTSSDPKRMAVIEKLIEGYLNATPLNHGYSLDSFLSKSTINHGGKKNLLLYIVHRYKYGVTHSLMKKEGKKEVTIRRYEKIIKQAENQMNPVLWSFKAEEDGSIPVMLAFQNSGKTSYLRNLTEIEQSIVGLQSRKRFIERLISKDGSESGITVYSCYLDRTSAKYVEEYLNKSSLLSIIPQSTKLSELFITRKFTVRQLFYAYTVMKFCFYFSHELQEEYILLKKKFRNDPTNLARLVRLHSKQTSETLTESRIISSIENHIELMHHIFVDFAQIAGGEKAPELNQSILKAIKSEVDDPFDVFILSSFLSFNAHMLKTNFYKFDKSAIAYRLDPKVLGDSRYEELPYGLFLIIGNDFTGFHIRFADIARGGVRVIKSSSSHAFRVNQIGLFAENFGLALTQNKKNKDIPEGGSKGTILLSREYQENTHMAFKKYIDALLDVILVEGQPDVCDHYGKPELLFLGPDENTADLMKWAAEHAQKRKYSQWKSFTTGKPPELGGIPHDFYGMTTCSVHEYALGIYEKLNLNENEVTKIQTGGPSGDLGSNEILMSSDKTLGIVDESGVLFDPMGINRDELIRLAKNRLVLSHFNPMKLSSDGFFVHIHDKNITLPDGSFIENGILFRNTFHLSDYAQADIFIPCGGRPESISSNVSEMFLPDGSPKFKYIVEGANLFITQDAREILEEQGVILYKDASTNKGGVTSSSFEVLAALALSNEEFQEHMMVKNGVIPPFYQRYVEEIIQLIKSNAREEFNCIWNEHEKTKVYRSIITDQLSERINELSSKIQESEISTNKVVQMGVLGSAMPQELINLVGLKELLNRLPAPYLKVVVSSRLASRFIYEYGLHGSEFEFFNFLYPYVNGDIHQEHVAGDHKRLEEDTEETIKLMKKNSQRHVDKLRKRIDLETDPNRPKVSMSNIAS